MTTPAFLEMRFPTNISYGAVGGQGWSTRIVETDAGYEYRQQLWAHTRGKWTVGHNLRDQADWNTLIAFHRLCLGRTIGFRFQDWTDYTDQGLGTVSLNASGQWQLSKTYQNTDVFGSTWDNVRLISKPQPSTMLFFLNGVSQGAMPGLLDFTTGVLTFVDNSPDPSHVWTWTGQFDIPCRFDTDVPQLSMDIPSGVGWRGIPIIEIPIVGQ
ncbi:MAG: DUF2460 domain-containing protein [Patescibacteria group bacterium]|nr:DUF2460 domain-containing protein [Patescibacteria group bacterium]